MDMKTLVIMNGSELIKENDKGEFFMNNEVSPLWGQVERCFYLVGVMIIVCLVMTICNLWTIGYEYYENAEVLAAAESSNILEDTIEEYLRHIQGEGYIISDLPVDYGNITYKKTLIRKKDIDEISIKNLIKEKINVIIILTKVKIKDDNIVYYFQTEDKANEFIEELNKYIEQEYELECGNGQIEDITSPTILEEKIQAVKAEKEELKVIEKRKLYTGVSRGGYIVRKYNAPMDGYTMISSYYGWRSSGWHSGVDFATAAGTDIYAWKDGTVTFAGWSGNYGYFIIVEHNDNTISRYAHCSKILVEEGQTVVKGETIGLVGSTGRSTGPHLHLEILVDGVMQDPLNYLTF